MRRIRLLGRSKLKDTTRVHMKGVYIILAFLAT
jgi:hypothetical protein